MALTTAEKQQIIKGYQKAEGDTGSVEVQVSLLTEDIKKLTGHFKAYKKDYHSRRGLMSKVNRRRKLLQYLRRTAIDRYRMLIERLSLRELR